MNDREPHEPRELHEPRKPREPQATAEAIRLTMARAGACPGIGPHPV